MFQPSRGFLFSGISRFAQYSRFVILFESPKGRKINKKMSKTQKTVWWVVGIVVVVGLVWWGVSKNSGSGNTIKIGFIGPLTGDAAVYGEPFQKTVQLAVNEINASGGVGSKQIQMIYEDDKCDGRDGADAVQKLVNVDGVQAIVGSMCSSATLAGVPIAAQGKVVLFSPGASSPKLTGAGPYFFRDYVSDAAQGKVLANVAYNQKKWRTVAFIQEQTDYTQGIYDAFSQNFQGYGGKTINQAFPSDTTDFRSILTTLRSQNPDALFIDTQAPASTARVLDQLAQLGWKPHLLIDDATAGDAPTLQKYASQLNGAITAEFLPSKENATFQHLNSAYRAAYGTDVPYYSYMGPSYDSIYLLVQGIEKVGYNGQALAAWSRTISNWPGASGLITIGPDGDRVGGHTAEVINNGQKSVLQ
jgi:branched-chain amino acid transport system substrate-binding protein